ncbi:MAG: hypothetical protein K8I00_12300, partial [Candidatus Omnitrophica bacterium]|nr:hypothetical protein [Candidatus Omnitrophota bacterium]
MHSTKISHLQIFCMAILVVFSPGEHANAQCLSPALTQRLTVQRDVGGIPLYAVPEADAQRIDHVEHMLTQLLSKNDRSGGQIRQNMVRANVVFLVFKDSPDYERFEDEVERQSRECMRVPILAVEVHYPGSQADRAGMVDESFNDVAEHVYYFGVKSA